MVRFTVQNLGEHIIDNMVVKGPFSNIVMEMAEMFLATYSGPPEADMDYDFAEHIIHFSGGQGKILEYRPNRPGTIH